MEDLDLPAVRERYELARMAGIDADEAGNGWDAAKIRALVASWQDVATLHDEVKRLREWLSPTAEFLRSRGLPVDAEAVSPGARQFYPGPWVKP